MKRLFNATNECHSEFKMANMWGHISRPNQRAALPFTPRGDPAPLLAVVATLLWRTQLVSPRPSLGSRVLVSVLSLCVVQWAAEELVLPQPERSTFQKKRKNRSWLFSERYFLDSSGDSSTTTGSNFDFLWSCMRSATDPSRGVSTVRADGEPLSASACLGFWTTLGGGGRGEVCVQLQGRRIFLLLPFCADVAQYGSIFFYFLFFF